MTILLIVGMGQDLDVAASDGHIVPASGEEGNFKLLYENTLLTCELD